MRVVFIDIICYWTVVNGVQCGVLQTDLRHPFLRSLTVYDDTSAAIRFSTRPITEIVEIFSVRVNVSKRIKDNSIYSPQNLRAFIVYARFVSNVAVDVHAPRWFKIRSWRPFRNVGIRKKMLFVRTDIVIYSLRRVYSADNATRTDCIRTFVTKARVLLFMFSRAESHKRASIIPVTINDFFLSIGLSTRRRVFILWLGLNEISRGLGFYDRIDRPRAA